MFWRAALRVRHADPRRHHKMTPTSARFGLVSTFPRTRRGAFHMAESDLRRRNAARFGGAVGADGLIRLVAYGALLSPRVLDGRGLGGIHCDGPCVVLGKRLAFRVRRSAYATLLPLEPDSPTTSGASLGTSLSSVPATQVGEAEGCVYRMSAAQIFELAEREGGYRLERVRVRMASSDNAPVEAPLAVPRSQGGREANGDAPVVEAMAFIGTAWDLLPADGLPSARYLEKVQMGAEARGLSARYRAWLLAHETREGERSAAATAGRRVARDAQTASTPTERTVAVVLAGLLGSAALAATLTL